MTKDDIWIYNDIYIYICMAMLNFGKPDFSKETWIGGERTSATEIIQPYHNNNNQQRLIRDEGRDKNVGISGIYWRLMVV